MDNQTFECIACDKILPSWERSYNPTPVCHSCDEDLEMYKLHINMLLELDKEK